MLGDYPRGPRERSLAMVEPAAQPRWRRMVVPLAALVAAAGTARLGVWQLDRAAQKTALFQAHQAQAALPPLAQSALPSDAPLPSQLLFRRVRLAGQWLAERTVYLDNRQMNGRPGFFVITPLLIANDDAVLVQRGWLPRDPAVRTHIVPPPTPQGRVEVEGSIVPGAARLFEFDSAASGPIRQNLDIDRYARETGLHLRPLLVLQAGGDTAEGLRREWLPAVLDVSMHYGYALQWFSLSALVTGLYVWFQLIRPRLRRTH